MGILMKNMRRFKEPGFPDLPDRKQSVLFSVRLQGRDQRPIVVSVEVKIVAEIMTGMKHYPPHLAVRADCLADRFRS